MAALVSFLSKIILTITLSTLTAFVRTSLSLGGRRERQPNFSRDHHLSRVYLKLQQF